MKVKMLGLGPLLTNCYIVSNDAKDAYIIDPAGEGSKIIEVLSADGLMPRAILLTHAHPDHMAAAPEVSTHYGISVVLHPDDLELYRSRANQLPGVLPLVTGLPEPLACVEADIPRLEFQALHIPGHTRGGVGFYFKEAGILFSGDTLFYRSVGRTDLPGGNAKTLLRSIRETLFKLPEETIVCPGHGPDTTIGEEMEENPYV